MVHSSNSRNVIAAETGIQRVAMAALMMVLAVGGLAMSAGDAAAQSRLPPCQGERSVIWHNCFGTYTWAPGRKYVGEFKDNKYNGQGTLTDADGNKYVGEHKGGQPDGQGTFTYADGSKYVGEWKDGKYNGQGTFSLPNGSK